MDVRIVLWRRLSAEELMLLNCGVGEDSWESLGLQEIQSVLSKGDQPWVFFGRTDTEASTPILWPVDAMNWLIGKDPDAGRDWGQEEKGTTEDGMAGWHHWLDGLESEWTPEVGYGQRGLVCCDSWGRKESDTTERLNWTELSAFVFFTQIFFWNFKSSTFWKVKKKSLFDFLHIKTNVFCFSFVFTVMFVFNESRAFFNTT